MTRCALCDFDDYGNHATSCPVGKEIRLVEADRETRIRALATRIVWDVWKDKAQSGPLGPVLTQVCMERAADIVDAIDALPVSEKQP